MVGVVQDITARKRVEIALMTRTQHFDAVRAVSAEITRELDLKRLLGLIVDRAMALVHAERSTIRLLYRDRLVGVIAAGWGHADIRRFGES